MTDLSRWAAEAKHVVVVCGGAVSGSEAAALCAEQGACAIVLEQNRRPYGKIEDGLPRWHDKLRNQEYARIDQNLSRPEVLYVPCTGLGRDLALEAVLAWQPSAVLLASGAWRDRPLPVPGAEAFVGRGLLYQNPLVHWFNHAHEPAYDGTRYDVPDGSIVVGGGLASVDVAKILSLTVYQRALSARGIDVDLVTLEHKGIGPTLASHGLSPEALGVRGATLYYRRRIADMPVAFPRGEGEEARRKVEKVRERLIGVLRDKFLVHVEPLHVPVAPIVEGDRMVGLRFQRTEVREGRVSPVAGSEYEVRSPLVVSSIGSVPAPIEGVPMNGELFDFESAETGRVRGQQRVFGLGNVLTGKGNIKDSRRNALEISQQVLEAYVGDGVAEADGGALDGAHDRARSQAQALVDSALSQPPLTPSRLAPIAEVVRTRWQAVGYDGDYAAWVAS